MLAAAVISVVEGRVTHLLQGHTREVAELAAAGAGAPRLLLSLSKDGNLRLWDVPTEACLSSIQTDATCIVSGECGHLSLQPQLLCSLLIHAARQRRSAALSQRV